jgi:HSP20 family protein
MEKAMDNFFHGFGLSQLREIEQTAFLPKLDVSEKDNTIFVEAELPGLTKDNVNVEVNDGILTITGEKTETKENKERGWISTERIFGKFDSPART